MRRVVLSPRATQRRFRGSAEWLSDALGSDRYGYPPVVVDTVPVRRSWLDYIRTRLLSGKVIKIINSLRHLCEECRDWLPNRLHRMIRVNYKHIISTWCVNNRGITDVLNDTRTRFADPPVLVSDLGPFGNARFNEDTNLIRCQEADHLLTDLTVDLVRESCDQRTAAVLCTLINICKQHTNIRRCGLV